MSLFNERRRPKLIFLAALALGAGYLFVYLPLGQHAAKQKEPLDKAGRALAGLLGQTNSPVLDFTGITNQLTATRAALDTLESVRAKAAGRADLGDLVRERMSLPFQLVDYETERSRQQNQLRQLATKQKVTVAPGVWDGFPAHTFAVTRPDLLWAELALVESLLTTAVQCQVGTIHSLQLPVAVAEQVAAPGSRAPAEVPMQIELTGAAPAVTRFLQSLPLRADELKTAGLPEAATHKPALYVDRLMVRKQTPEKPDEVRASVRVVGFIFPD